MSICKHLRGPRVHHPIRFIEVQSKSIDIGSVKSVRSIGGMGNLARQTAVAQWILLDPYSLVTEKSAFTI